MLDYKLIEALALVCQEGGFDRAARVLLLTQSAVSQRVRQLEGQLGVPLVVRESPPRPTRVGNRLIAHYRRVGQLERDLQDDLQPGTRDGFLTLSIGVNEDSIATWFTAAVAELARERGYLLHFAVDDQGETHKLLKQGEVLGCISTRTEALQGCSVVYLGRVDYRCVASPGFIEQWFPDGFDAASAGRAPAVVYSPKDLIHDHYLEGLFGAPCPPFPHHFIPSSHGFIDAIVGGLGYGLLPHLQSGELLASGQVVELRPGPTLPTHLYWHHWDLQAGPIRELTAALVRYTRRHLPQGGA
jgi:LysR family transcriptional regulator (chromosome initiation inhibitor)